MEEVCCLVVRADYCALSMLLGHMPSFIWIAIVAIVGTEQCYQGHVSTTAVSRHETLQYDYAHQMNMMIRGLSSKTASFPGSEIHISQYTNEDCTYTGSSIVH